MQAISLIGVVAAFSLIFLSLLALCVEHGFRPDCKVAAFFKRLSPTRRLLLLVFVGILAIYAGTKDDDSTNAPPTRLSARRRIVAIQPGVTISESETNLGYRVQEVRDGNGIVLPTADTVTNESWRLRGAYQDAFRIGMDPEPTEEDWMLNPLPDFQFPWRDSWMFGLTVFANGRFHPSAKDEFFPQPFEADVSLVPQGKWGEIANGGLQSLFWHELTPSNSLVLTWQNALYGRDANCPTNFQAELFDDGSFDYRYPDRTVSYAPVFPFDWDGDGLENSVDPEPLVAGPDAHGTNIEWYNTVCSNVFTVAEGDDGIVFSPRHAGVNTNAYYFVDVVAERGPAPIYFTADGESNLGNPIIVAQAGVTNHVPLLIGATYTVSAAVPFGVQVPSGVETSYGTSDGLCQRVCWPVPITFQTGDGGSITPNIPEELQQRLDGSFSWSGGCCVSLTGDELAYSCSSCGCGGCSAVAAYRYEKYSLFKPAVTCGCASSGGDATETPFVSTVDGATVAAGFSRKFVMISDDATDGTVRSTRTVLTLAAWGGANGGTLHVEPANFDRLQPIEGVLPTSSVLTLLPYETYSAVVTNEGVVASESLDDVRVRLMFEENNTGTRIVRNARMTVCALSVTGIKFNHDIDGTDVDAINIRLDGTENGVYDIRNGEWCGRGATNCPACYVGGVRPLVWARFAVKPDDVSNVRLAASAAIDGFALGDVPERVVSFIGGDSDWVELPTCDGTNTVPQRVDISSSRWNWTVGGIGGYSLVTPFCFSETGPHKVYTVLAVPKYPWKRYPNRTQCPWSYALERACTWAKGATTPNEALVAVTSNIFYNCGLKYDIKDGKSACLADGYKFDLTKYIMRCSGDAVNCFDQAYAVYLFGNLLGADARVKQLEPFGYLKRTQLVGRGYTNNPFYGNSDCDSNACCAPDAVGRSSFIRHFFCMSDGYVFDGCAGPVLGTIGLEEYLRTSIDSERSPANSHPGTVENVSDYIDVIFFK